MKTLACSAVSGHDECPYVANGETEDAVMQDLMQHGQSVHAMSADSEEDKKAMEEKMKANMQDDGASMGEAAGSDMAGDDSSGMSGGMSDSDDAGDMSAGDADGD